VGFRDYVTAGFSIIVNSQQPTWAVHNSEYPAYYHESGPVVIDDTGRECSENPIKVAAKFWSHVKDREGRLGEKAFYFPKERSTIELTQSQVITEKAFSHPIDSTQYEAVRFDVSTQMLAQGIDLTDYYVEQYTPDLATKKDMLFASSSLEHAGIRVKEGQMQILFLTEESYAGDKFRLVHKMYRKRSKNLQEITKVNASLFRQKFTPFKSQWLNE
jgi:hypothetical protein